MPPQESEPDGHYGKWKMEDCNLGSAGCQPALPNPETEKEMPDRASLAIRHLVGVSNQTKAELCVTVVFSELWFLSIPKSLRHIQKASIDYLLGLAVDLCLPAKSEVGIKN